VHFLAIDGDFPWRGDPNGDQGTARVVNDHLIDDNLGEERGSAPRQLDGERGQQHVTPNRSVLQQFWDEPAKAEFRRCGTRQFRFALRIG
jgi:hypothetical protein